MANVIAPTGFRPLKSITGSPYNGEAGMYHIPSTDTSVYAIGDLVQTAANSDVNGVPDVSKCASAASRIRGAVVGIFVTPPNGLPTLQGAPLTLELINIPSAKTKDYYVLIADDPHLLFEVQDDGLAVLGQTAANKNIDFTVTNGSFFSASTLKTSTVAVTSTLPLRIVGAKQVTNNNITLAYGTWLVLINQHDLGANTAGI